MKHRNPGSPGHVLSTEAREYLQKAVTKQAKYYNNLRKREVNIKVADKVIVETYVLISAAKAVVAKFAPKYEGPYEVIECIVSSMKVLKEGKTRFLNIDQVRIYKSRREHPDHLESICLKLPIHFSPLIRLFNYKSQPFI